MCMTVFSAITPGWQRSGEPGAVGGWNLPDEAWLPIVYWVFAGSCVAYSCCSFANSILPASVVAAYTCLQPLVGVVFSWLLLGEGLAWRDAAGVLIILGLLVTSASNLAWIYLGLFRGTATDGGFAVRLRRKAGGDDQGRAGPCAGRRAASRGAGVGERGEGGGAGRPGADAAARRRAVTRLSWANDSPGFFRTSGVCKDKLIFEQQHQPRKV